MPRPSEKAFSLVEVAVAIGVMAILAAAAVPLVMKALTQQREAATRESIKSAYEAIIGSRDRKTLNMKADFGFNPPALLADLRFMRIRTPGAAYRNGPIPVAWGTAAGGFIYGWNGPYWNGSIRAVAGTNGVPVDSWGRPLRWAANQVQSSGRDGAFNTADDLVYPPGPAAMPTCSVIITIERQLPPPTGTPTSVTLQITVLDRNANVAPRSQTPLSTVANPWPHTFPASLSASTPAITVNPGPVTIGLASVPADPNYAQSQTLDLLPGETRSIIFRLNN
jgi:prepilin-type N-terminal cleavage/methylation domain-containing protein